MDSFFRKASGYLAVYKFRFAGMGFMWAWIYCCWFTSALFPNSDGFTINASSSWLLSSVAIALTLVASPFILKDGSALGRASVRTVALACLVAGTFAMGEADVNGIAFPLLRHLGAFATGVGNGLLWLMWCSLYSRMKTELVEIAIPASALLVPACLFVVHDLSGMVALVVLMTLPVASMALLYLSESETDSFEEVEGDPMPKRVFWPEFLRIGVAAIAIHSVVATVWALVPASYFQAAGGWFGPPIIVGTVAAVAMSVIMILFSRRPDIFTMYRYLLPVLALALAFFSFGTFASETVACTLIMVSQLGYSTVLYVFFARVAHAGWGTSVVCLGLSRGFSQVGIALGTLLAHRLAPMLASADVHLAHVCIVLICLCVVPSLLLLNRESDFRFMPSSPAVFSKDHTVSLEDEGFGPEEAQSPLETQCGIIASEAGLSSRELEVFILLAQGRSIPYVRDVLYISKNTADTHAKNIYRKLGIHSRQELIDLAQSYSCGRDESHADLP